ncbi:coiled-coil domain-containing protein 187 [Erythrolamprus reginae]|uniref:coiled-coil domain-containing protein 187 n=1 Tax=Erythrolamprus reginae TaxID=121349 RepID=UPI00396C9E9E
MVEQSLREEELRARHQGALLRLREKALREKAQAELAWLEHGERSPNGLQGRGGPSSTAEKQLSILTRLRQEQAEIRHLQNIGRAAHQERKLLLQQQKELLEVQKATTQLWLQLAGQLPHQISENYDPQAPEKKKFEASFKTAPVLATCSEGRERRSSREADKKHLAEWKDILPPENRVAEGFAKWKAGHLASRGEKEHDPGLTKNSHDDHRGSPLDKGPEGLASTGPSPMLRGFCPSPGKSPSGLEFHKGYAVLVTLSGSSPSHSDAGEDGLQDTDVSLPEEFVFQEPPPDGLGVSTHHEAPAVPRIVINTEHTPSCSEKEPRGQISVGDSTRAPYSQKKTWEGPPGTERGRLLETLSHGTNKDHIHSPTLRSTATSLSISEDFSCAENGGNETAFPSPVDLGMDLSSTNDPFQGPEAEGKKDPVSSLTGDNDEDENPTRFDNKEASVTLAPGASLNIAAQDSGQPLHGREHSPRHKFPNSSDHLLVSGDSGANRSTDECASHKPDEARLQLNATSVGNNRDLVEGHQKSSPGENQNINEAEMKPTTVHLRSPQEEGDAVRLSNPPLSELEDDVVSPVDEMLTYGSSDLPSSTEKEASSWSSDLPAPPEDLSGKDDFEGNWSLLDFPSPPDPVGSSEVGELSSPRDRPAEGLGSPPQA